MDDLSVSSGESSSVAGRNGGAAAELLLIR